MSANFVHLRFHSEYSIQDGIVRLDPILEEVMAQGGVALGITDSMNLFGALRFYSHAMADGIKPIVGCDLWVTNPIQGKRDQPYRLTVYCQSHDGYLSLCELLSKGWMENQYLGRGEVRMEWLTPENCKGLICLSGGPQGILEQHLLEDEKAEALAIVEQLKAAFPDRFYLEVQRAGRRNDEAVVAGIAELAEQTGLPMVATHPVQFLHKDDFDAHEARCCIADGYVLADPHRPRPYTEEQYLKTEEEMRALFADIPQAIDNTVVIAQRCNLDGVFQKPQLPLFPTPEGVSLDEYMSQLSHEGLERRLEFLYPDKAERDARRPEYVERLEYELKTISSMKFPGYFLIVQDFINWSKRNGVAVGPGRGSGAGSLVAYALGITDLDPLHYGLLFERFLNPERVSMPDFDVDFCQYNRDRTIEYVKRTYGADAVSQIVTFGAMGAKAVVRDVGRVLNMGYGKVDELAKLIPQKPGLDVTLAKAAEMEPAFKDKSEEPDYVELMNYAGKLEGITRNLGMHAGGVLIAPSKLTNFCPLYNADGRPENTVSQFDKKDIENVGLVKFDFLGLTTLTILSKAAEYIDRLNPGTKFDLARIPTNDKQTLELFQQGNTGAVFQFESDGMREQLRKAKPDCLEDLVALNALYRPGPMDQIPHFIDRKFGREKVEYLDPRMEPILRETYGIMVYQEQVMLVARAIGGYSLGGADLLRRAMGKKNVEEMKRQRAVFIQGAAERGVTAETATEIFDLMEKFAGYGFNKSHAAAYSYVAWQTAYLKVHHTACFIAGNMCLVMNQGEKMRELVEGAREMGVSVRQPDINISEWYFTVPDAKTIRFGFGAIKGVGQNIVEDLLDERLLNGPFLDIFDVAARVHSMNRKVLEQLIKAGAFDSIDKDRGKLFANVENAIQAGQAVAASFGQASLFADENGLEERIVNWKKAEKWDDRKLYTQERDAFGFCLTGDMFDPYRVEARNFSIPFKDVRDSREQQTIAGIVQSVRTVAGKRGNFGIVVLSDGQTTMDVLVFARAYENYRQMLKPDEMLIFTGKGRKDERSGGMSFVCDEVLTIEQMRVRHGATLQLELTEGASLESLVKTLQAGKSDSVESVPCEISLSCNGIEAQITLQSSYAPTDSLVNQLRNDQSVASAKFVY